MSIFKDHGTKLIGGLTTLVGLLGAVDPVVLQSAIGEKGVGYVVGAAGILTILRGFQNSKNQTPQ